MILVPLMELLSYIAFSFVAGYLVFRLIRKQEAAVQTPRSDVLAGAASAALVTSGPVINLVSVIGAQNGYGKALLTVLFQTAAGHVWLGIFLLAICVWVLLYVNKLPMVTLVLFLSMLFLRAYGSHPDEGIMNTFAHLIHLSAAVFWVGVLVHACFYTDERFNWESFLKWFSPFTAVLVMAVIGSGVVTMSFAMDMRDYGNVLMLTYGQMLLIKHIVFIPVLVFTVINMFLVKQVRQHSHFQPLNWIRAEAFLLAIVFACSALLKSSAAPANIAEALSNAGAAPIFGSIFQRVTATSVATWYMSITGIVCFAGAGLFLVSILYFFKKRAKAGFALAAACAASGLLYAAIMTSLRF
ncbi:putative copper resistance protein D [Terribacillus aidingensis]|uniref:Putative copper resistance protein D n=1 Tax=Terribacillus aidingensis TaxID=586416 RepID=A0A285P9V8_9BACI|nr:CopD family protein [Terribacillus aidingensis]SNZ16916.1 putative copper resistance protein D [Terribacillus aidingensis]